MDAISALSGYSHFQQMVAAAGRQALGLHEITPISRIVRGRENESALHISVSEQARAKAELLGTPLRRDQMLEQRPGEAYGLSASELELLGAQNYIGEGSASAEESSESATVEGEAVPVEGEGNPHEPGASEEVGVDGEALTEEEIQVLDELQARDLEVRAHEQAHMAAAGGLAKGGASFEYQTGPDGKRYAVGGEVHIDVSEGRTPEETIRKAEQIRAAALAPAEPSGQDQRVAAQASQMASQARVEMAREEQEPEETDEVTDPLDDEVEEEDVASATPEKSDDTTTGVERAVKNAEASKGVSAGEGVLSPEALQRDEVASPLEKAKTIYRQSAAQRVYGSYDGQGEGVGSFDVADVVSALS